MDALSPNGLIPHSDFPSRSYEAIHVGVNSRWSGHPSYYQFSGAWNAVAYRFQGSVDAGLRFQKSLVTSGANPAPLQRYNQEEALFGFFSNGFAAFEALFYGMFAVGSFLVKDLFPLETPKDERRVSPTTAQVAFKKAFPQDALVIAIETLISDEAYLLWRDMRNVLTHRAAPGRRVYVGIGTDDAPPVEWKLNGLPLDSTLVPTHRAHLSSLISTLMQEVDLFLKRRT